MMKQLYSSMTYINLKKISTIQEITVSVITIMIVYFIWKVSTAYFNIWTVICRCAWNVGFSASQDIDRNTGRPMVWCDPMTDVIWGRLNCVGARTWNLYRCGRFRRNGMWMMDNIGNFSCVEMMKLVSLIKFRCSDAVGNHFHDWNGRWKYAFLT